MPIFDFAVHPNFGPAEYLAKLLIKDIYEVPTIATTCFSFVIIKKSFN